MAIRKGWDQVHGAVLPILLDDLRFGQIELNNPKFEVLPSNRLLVHIVNSTVNI